MDWHPQSNQFLNDLGEHYKNKIINEDLEKIKLDITQDHKMTQYFIQDFMDFMNDVCHMIIIVVNQLTHNDFKIVDRLIKNREHEVRPIFVIHNLFEFESKEQVVLLSENLIQGAFNSEKILNSDLVPHFRDYGRINEHSFFCKAFHLMVGKEGCESGNFFNDLSFKKLLLHISPEYGTTFDFLEKLNAFWFEKYQSYTNSFNELP